MRIAHLLAGVQERPPRLHREPPGPAPLQARHPGVVGHRVPLVQLRVCVDDLRILQQPVAEVVDHGGDVEDTAQTLIKSRLTHNFILLTEPQPHPRAWSRAGGLFMRRTVLLLPRTRLPQVSKASPTSKNESQSRYRSTKCLYVLESCAHGIVACWKAIKRFVVAVAPTRRTILTAHVIGPGTVARRPDANAPA